MPQMTIEGDVADIPKKEKHRFVGEKDSDAVRQYRFPPQAIVTLDMTKIVTGMKKGDIVPFSVTLFGFLTKMMPDVMKKLVSKEGIIHDIDQIMSGNGQIEDIEDKDILNMVDCLNDFFNQYLKSS